MGQGKLAVTASGVLGGNSDGHVSELVGVDSLGLRNSWAASAFAGKPAGVGSKAADREGSLRPCGRAQIALAWGREDWVHSHTHRTMRILRTAILT